MRRQTKQPFPELIRRISVPKTQNNEIALIGHSVTLVAELDFLVLTKLDNFKQNKIVCSESVVIAVSPTTSARLTLRVVTAHFACEGV
ncbi:hypothetical protein OAH97_01045 [Octadecabacter sp.]|nr:hypothetical protein [Octadecabacter sp.]